jgi:hypothetical protein
LSDVKVPETAAKTRVLYSAPHVADDFDDWPDANDEHHARALSLIVSLKAQSITRQGFGPVFCFFARTP